jgi:hypothetical protein
VSQATVLGHSHCNAFAEAKAENPGRWPAIAVHRLEDKRAKDDAVSIPAAVALLKGQPPGAPTFFAIMGAYHNLLGLLRSGETFDVLMGADDRPDGGATALVPQRALRSAISEQFEQSAKMRNLMAAARGPVFIVSTPPPKRNNDFILERFMRQKKQIYRGKAVEQFGVERPETRLKLWLLEAQLMTEWAESLGAGFLAPPAAASDEDGFLGENYYSDDVTHANAAYGALVLDQVAAILERSSKQVSHG